MLTVRIDNSDLLRWQRRLAEMQRDVPRAITKALNATGDALVKQIAKGVADEMNLSEHEVEADIRVTRATTGNNKFTVDLSALFREQSEPGTSRRLDKRGFQTPDDDPFEPGQLVKVVTAGDELVCQACEDIADDSPYTIEEARQLLPHHPHCRCTVVPFYPTARMPVSFTTRMGGAQTRKASSISELVTLGQLADKLKDELKFALKVT